MERSCFRPVPLISASLAGMRGSSEAGRCLTTLEVSHA